jgi:hypothetical protein
MLLSAHDVGQFHARGFIQLPQISTPAEIRRLQPIFARLFAERAGREEGNQYDLLGYDEDGDDSTLSTIINPVNYARELRDLIFRRNALAIAQQLLGRGVTPSFEQCILKPPHQGAATPWHQDEAYRIDPGFAYKQLSIWMPLAEARADNGCMHFIPESNLGPVLQHHTYRDDPRIHAIECIGSFDPATAVVCPLPAGGATVHDGRTLHFAGPNVSNEPRFAYILAFEIPPVRLLEKRDFNWNRGKQTRNAIQRSFWRRRGGWAIEAVRKYRNGLRSPARILFELKRSTRALLGRIRNRD